MHTDNHNNNININNNNNINNMTSTTSNKNRSCITTLHTTPHMSDTLPPQTTRNFSLPTLTTTPWDFREVPLPPRIRPSMLSSWAHQL